MSNLGTPSISAITARKVLNVETVTFNAKFSGMRKEQEFIVYPVQPNASSIVIQSDTRIGEIHLDTGICRISKSFPNGAGIGHLAMANDTDLIATDDLQKLKNNLVISH